MKTYELLFEGIDIISAVEKPAVESTLMAFSNEKPLMFQDEEKMIFYSVAMRPDKMIYRQDVNGEPANVFYSADTVVKMQQDYFRNANNTATNVEHNSETVTGIFPFESWIVENTENDKAIAMGLDVKKGDWVMGYKVDCPDVWGKVKSGEINGLSIESTKYKLNQVNMNKQEEELTFYEKVKALFAMQPPVVEEPEDVKEPEAPEVEEPEDLMEELKAENEALKAEVADLKEKLATLEADKVKAETELVSMSKQAMSVEKVVNAPVEVKMSAEEEKLVKFKRNHGINI